MIQVYHKTNCTVFITYSKGIKPTNVQSSIQKAINACHKSKADEFWVDMESGVRTRVIGDDGNEKDIFDLSKCYECIDLVCEMGLMDHPESLR